MKKIIILMMVLVVSLFAQEIDRQLLEVKIKKSPEYLRVSTSFVDNTIQKNTKEEYVNSFRIKADGKILFEVEMSPFLVYKYPSFVLKIKDEINDDELEFVVTCNTGKQEKQKFKINQQDTLFPLISKIKTRYLSLHEIKSGRKNIWNVKIPEEAMQEVYGSVQGSKYVVNFNLSEYYKSPGPSIFFSSKGSSKFKSIAIATDANPNAMVAIIRQNVEMTAK